MAQRHEIEAWVNPSAWEDPAEAERVIDQIEAAGTDDEAEWVRIAGGGEEDVRTAEELDLLRAEALIGDRVMAYREAEATLATARDDLYEALRTFRRSGVSAYRLAQVTGLSQAMTGRITRDCAPGGAE